MAYQLAGMRFGRLTVLKKVPKPKQTLPSGSYWLCKCDCGTEKIVKGNSLTGGFTNSCGCYKREVSSAMMRGVPLPQVLDDGRSINEFHRHLREYSKTERQEKLKTEISQYIGKTIGRYTPVKVVDFYGDLYLKCIIDGKLNHVTEIDVDTYLHNGMSKWMYH